MHSKIVSQRYVLVLMTFSDKASMNLKSFKIYDMIITTLYHATCIKQCVRWFAESISICIIFHCLATKLDGNSIFDNY